MSKIAKQNSCLVKSNPSLFCTLLITFSYTVTPLSYTVNSLIITLFLYYHSPYLLIPLVSGEFHTFRPIFYHMIIDYMYSHKIRKWTKPDILDLETRTSSIIPRKSKSKEWQGKSWMDGWMCTRSGINYFHIWKQSIYNNHVILPSYEHNIIIIIIIIIQFPLFTRTLSLLLLTNRMFSFSRRQSNSIRCICFSSPRRRIDFNNPIRIFYCCGCWCWFCRRFCDFRFIPFLKSR